MKKEYLLPEYASCIQIIPAAAVLTSEAGKIILANDRFCRLLGYQDQQLEEKQCQVLSPRFPELRRENEAVRTKLYTSSGSQIPITLESIFVNSADHGPIWMSIATILRGETREHTYWETLFSYAREGIVIIDHDHRVVAANPAFCSMLGYAEAELLSMHTWDYDAYLSERMIRDQFVLTEDMDTVIETRHIRKDGSQYDVEVSITGIRKEHTGLYLCICRDITEKKRFETESYEAGQQIIDLLEQMNEGCISLNTHWKCIYANSRATELLGKSQNELLGACIWEVFPELINSPFYQAACQAMKTQKFVSLEYHYAPTDDWYEARIYPSQAGVKIFIQLITEQKRSREQELFRHSFQKLLSDTSSEFISSSPDQFSQTVDQMLSRFGKFLSVDRSYYLSLSEDSTVLTITNEWCAPGIQPKGKSFRKFRLQHYPWLEEQLKRKEAVHISEGDALPAYASREKQAVIQQNIQSISLFPVYDEDTILGILGLDDVSKQRSWGDEQTSLLSLAAHILAEAIKNYRMEDELISSRRRLTNIIQATRTGTWEWNLKDGRITCNEQFAQIIGYPLEELSDFHIDTWRSLIPQEEVEQSKILLDQHFSSREKSYEFEGRIRHKQGHWLWTYVRGSIVSSGRQGKPLVVSGIIQDITERKTSEQQLLHSRDLMRYIIEHTPSAVAVHDRDLRYIFVSQQYLDEFQVADGNIIGKHHYEVFPDLPEKLRRVHQRCLAGEVIRKQDDLFPRDDGKIDWTNWECRPWFESDGSIGGIIVYTEIITERKKAEEERLRLQSQLAQASKMESVGRLAGGIAHDFNNMLQAILGHTELALDRIPDTHPIQEDLSAIHQAADKSADLTRQLLAFARKQTVMPKVINLNTVISGMVSMLDRLIGESVALIWEPGEHISNISIDPAQIDQVLINLCINSRDAIENQGKINIRTENLTQEGKEYIMLTVEDTGCGMDERTIRNVYDPFFTTKGVGEGSGLGLPMVYGIVTQNNGTIDISSTPGAGTTVKICFPRSDAPPSMPNQQELISSEEKTEGKTILMVEDEQAVLTLVEAMLKQMGHQVLATDSPQVALNLSQAHPQEIDLLLTDLIMPDMNGLELSRRIQKNQKHLRVLFMSGYTSDVISTEGLIESGMVILQKPFTSGVLQKKLQELFSSGSEESQ